MFYCFCYGIENTWKYNKNYTIFVNNVYAAVYEYDVYAAVYDDEHHQNTGISY